MKNRKIIILACLLASAFLTIGCAKSGSLEKSAAQPESAAGQTEAVQNASKEIDSHIKISVGRHIFYATLEHNDTAKALVEKLPLSVTMTELNGNEKYYRFSSPLPSADTNPGQIRTGEIMLFNGDYIVMFYKDFPTNYRYTKIGQIENTDGLPEALGSGNAAVTIERDSP
ncbi:MAG: cyclophilin-like fold protein [Mitsuokella sp.]|uniref:cyclophilin-like fold protein n=1 Tax=Mitsuokella sp. TaxID=2049034 RepID=UPI003EFF3FBA